MFSPFQVRVLIEASKGRQRLLVDGNSHGDFTRLKSLNLGVYYAYIIRYHFMYTFNVLMKV